MTDTSDMVGLGAYLQSITAKGGIDWNGEMQEDKARRLAMVEQANARAKEIEAHKQKMEEQAAATPDAPPPPEVQAFRQSTSDFPRRLREKALLLLHEDPTGINLERAIMYLEGAQEIEDE